MGKKRTHTRTRDRAIRVPGHDVLPCCNGAFTFFPRSARPHVRRISVRLLLDVSGAFVCTSWLAFSLPPVARGQHATQREVTCLHRTSGAMLPRYALVEKMCNPESLIQVTNLRTTILLARPWASRPARCALHCSEPPRRRESSRMALN